MSNAHIKLAAYVVPEFPSVAAFIFLELLPAEETVALLQQRVRYIETPAAGWIDSYNSNVISVVRLIQNYCRPFKNKAGDE